MNPEQRKKLEASTGLGKKGWAVDKRSGLSQDWGTVVDQVSILVGDFKHLIQRVRPLESPDQSRNFGSGQDTTHLIKAERKWSGDRTRNVSQRATFGNCFPRRKKKAGPSSSPQTRHYLPCAY